MVTSNSQCFADISASLWLRLPSFDVCLVFPAGACFVSHELYCFGAIVKFEVTTHKAEGPKMTKTTSKLE